MAKHQYSITVGNLGTVWDGTNGAAANVQYGQWVAQSRELTGRASGEPVTLFRDGEPLREYGGHRLYCYRLGDGNEGNYPCHLVRIENPQCPYRTIAALVANRYISGSTTRRHIVRNTQTEGEPEFGITATVYEGPRGEQAFGAAWITAELEPCGMADYPSLPVYSEPAEYLDRAALRMLRKGAA